MRSVSDLLERAADKAPDAVAFEGASEAWSYARLADDAQHLALTLSACGVEPGDRVGVALDGGYPALVSFWGVLAASAVYVPLGARTTPAALAATATHAEVAAIVDGRPAAGGGTLSGEPVVRYGSSSDALAACAGRTAPWTSGSGGRSRPRPRANPDDLACIFYTSGTTDARKGACHEHRSLLSFARWADTAFTIGKDDVVAAASAPTFDISLLELLVPAVACAAIVDIQRDLLPFPPAFAEAVRRASPTVLQLVPRIWRDLLAAAPLPSTLRVGIVTGEPMAPAGWRALRTAAAGARLFNVYGTTEVNDCACFELPTDWCGASGKVPIGKPPEHATIALIEPQSGEPTTDSGEVVVAGPTVMREYWRAPDETKRRLVTLDDGERFFRTGDIAQRSSDGELYVIGRVDRSLKLGGEWVHLETVEAIVEDIPGITEASTEVLDRGSRSVVALTAATDLGITLEEIQRHCAHRLPRAAWPQELVIVPRLRRNRHGKIVRGTHCAPSERSCAT